MINKESQRQTQSYPPPWWSCLETDFYARLMVLTSYRLSIFAIQCSLGRFSRATSSYGLKCDCRLPRVPCLLHESNYFDSFSGNTATPQHCNTTLQHCNTATVTYLHTTNLMKHSPSCTQHEFIWMNSCLWFHGAAGPEQAAGHEQGQSAGNLTLVKLVLNHAMVCRTDDWDQCFTLEVH